MQCLLPNQRVNASIGQVSAVGMPQTVRRSTEVLGMIQSNALHRCFELRLESVVAIRRSGLGNESEWVTTRKA